MKIVGCPYCHSANISEDNKRIPVLNLIKCSSCSREFYDTNNFNLRPIPHNQPIGNYDGLGIKVNNFFQVEKYDRDKQIEMYMHCTKRQLAEMLAERDRLEIPSGYDELVAKVDQYEYNEN